MLSNLSLPNVLLVLSEVAISAYYIKLNLVYTSCILTVVSVYTQTKKKYLNDFNILYVDFTNDLQQKYVI